MRIKIFSGLVIIILAFSCSSVTQLSKSDLSYFYNPNQKRINAGFVVFHKAKEFSTLFYRIKTSDLLYAKDKNSNSIRCIYRIRYKLLNDYNSKEVADSSSVIKVDSNSIKKEFIIDSLNFKTSEARNYVLQIEILDMQRKSELVNFVQIDKKSQNSAQNFLIKNIQNQPAFKNYFASYESFFIYVNSEFSGKLYVKHYRKDFPVALPPFSEQNENKIVLKPDSSFTMETANSRSKLHSFRKTGIYYIQKEQNATGGLVIFRFYDDFPEITNASAMMYPLMYITTKNEFDRMLLAKDKKESVDNYWMELAGNPNRARELIRRYYSRVREANMLFTSYEEGWKTDRGIIYIVYGPPNIVYKNTENETWIYGSNQSSRSIAFNFYRLANPFTDNDFFLSRSSNYKNSWYNSVESWRK